MKDKLLSGLLGLLLIILTVVTPVKAVGELELNDKIPLPKYKQKTVTPPQDKSKLDEYMKEMDKRKRQGIYSYTGSRKIEGPMPFKPGEVSLNYEFDGKRLTNSCPDDGVWSTVSKRRGMHLRNSFKTKLDDKEIMDAYKAKGSVQPLIEASAFTIKFNPYSPEIIFGPEIWKSWLPSDGNANGTLQLRSDFGKDPGSGLEILVNSKDIKTLPRKRAIDAFINLTFLTSARMAKSGYAVSPDYLLMLARNETNFNTTSHTKKNNFWGYRAYNTSPDSSQRFKSIEEGIEMVSKFLACLSPDPAISKHCVEGSPGDRNKHQYGSSPMGIEDVYSFPDTWDNELNKPWAKVQNMVKSDLPNLLKRSGKTMEEVFGTCK